MKKRIIIIGNTDTHLERIVKLNKFLSVFCKITSQVILLSALCPKVFVHKVKWIKVVSYRENRTSKIAKRLSSLAAQIKISIILLKQYRNFDIVLCLGGYLLPVLVCRLILRKKTIRYHAGPNPEYLGLSFPRLTHEKLTNYLCDKIIVPSVGCISHFNLNLFIKKIDIGYFHIEPTYFKDAVPYEQKPKNICYFGTVCDEKNGPRAVDKLILGFKESNLGNHHYKLIIGGDGPLLGKLNDYPRENVVSLGWLRHEDIKKWLDRSRLLVMPSKTEGLATIIIEAMARNTIVLTTPVGGSPDIIQDSETGFIMSENTSECIAYNMVRALYFSEIEKIVEKAETYAKRHFRIKKTLNKWQILIDDRD